MGASKRPHAWLPGASARSIARSASSGSRVSAWRKTKTSPAAAAAPAFICRARPRGASITRSASGAARAAVASALPPSTTMTSAPCDRNGSSAAAAASMPAASSSAGTMTERRCKSGFRGVVQRPVVIEEADLRRLRAHRLAIGGAVREEVGVLGERRFHRGISLVALLEILAVPVEDLRDLEPLGLRIVAVAGAVREEAPQAVLELRVELVGGEGFVAQHRAADRGAHHRDVHARIVVDAVLAQRLVLDEIEVRRLAEEREELVLPRGRRVEEAAEVADRLDVGVARENLLDRERVVGVDEEGLLLGLRPRVEFGLRHLLVFVEHGLEPRVVAAQARVVDARRVAVLDVLHVLLEQRVPRRVGVVEGEGRGAEDEGGNGQGESFHGQSSPWPGAGVNAGVLSNSRSHTRASTPPSPASPRVQALSASANSSWPFFA